MLLTIYNLPAKTRYVDVKSLIHSKCGFKDVILDNLTSESNDTKRVTVGLAEEEDAAILVRKINGLFVDGQQLYVETIKKKAASTVMDFGNQKEPLQPLLQQPYYQQNKFQPNYELSFAQMQQSRSQPMGYGGMYGSAQNTTANFGYPQQMQYQPQMMAQSMVGYDQRAPLGFSNQGKNPSVWSDQNDWNHAGNASAGNQISQQGRSGSRWGSTGDSSNRPHNDEPARDSNRDRSSRFGHDAPSRDTERSGPRRDFGGDTISRDRGRDAPRDLGRDRDQGRDRFQGRDRDQGRDRFQGRDRVQERDRFQGRDRARDAPARDRGREPLARNAPVREPPARNAPFREPPVRNARENGDALYNRRAQPPRAPTKRQITTPAAIYGQHVTDHSSQPKRTFSQQRDGPNQPRAKPQPKQKAADSNYVPPSKRPKKVAAQKSEKPQANVPANKNQAQVIAKKNKPADDPNTMPIRAATWRHQIASTVAKELMQNPKHQSDSPFSEHLLPALKRGIWARLEELFGGDYEIRMPDMLNIYKEKFGNDDTAFFNQVKETVKNNGSCPADVGQKAAPVKKKIASPAAVVSAPQVQPVQTPAIIPCYPHGDKKADKGLKKANAMIFQDETVLLAKMKPDLQKAVIDEMDEMAKEIASEFEAECDVQLKEFNEKAKAPIVVENCKKMVTVNLAKRLLNVGPIMLRIYTVPKTLSRTKLAPVLAKFGVVSLRKAQRKKPPVYYGTCETYDDHDRLCLMDSLIVEGCTVLIKPFQLTGKSEKRAININVGRDWLAVDKDHNNMEEELEDSDEEIDEDINNFDTEDQSNTQEDNDEQVDNEDEETGEPDQDQDVQNTDMADDEDTNGNIKFQTNEEEENTDQNDAENAQLAVESEIKTGEAEQIGSEPVEENENTEVDNTEQIVNTPKESKDDFKKEVENIDFTADVDVNTGPKNKNEDTFKISEETNLEAEKDLSEVNPIDLEDFKVNIIDTIDMADLNDDDLEDW